jgi:hypothetical protein
LVLSGRAGETPAGAHTVYSTPMSRRRNNSECICGYGGVPALSKSRFLPGHDAKAESKIKSAVHEGRVSELSSELRYYGLERGFIK